MSPSIIISSKCIPTLQDNLGFISSTKFLFFIEFWKLIAALVAPTGLSNSAIIESPAVWNILPANLLIIGSIISLHSFKLIKVFSSWDSICLLKPTQSAAKIVANFLFTSDI